MDAPATTRRRPTAEQMKAARQHLGLTEADFIDVNFDEDGGLIARRIFENYQPVPCPAAHPSEVV